MEAESAGLGPDAMMVELASSAFRERQQPARRVVCEPVEVRMRHLLPPMSLRFRVTMVDSMSVRSRLVGLHLSFLRLFQP